MSSQGINNPKFPDLDNIIHNKFEAILTHENINKLHPEHRKFDILENPLVFSSTEGSEYKEMSKEAAIDALKTLKREHSELISLFNQVDKERKALKVQNFKLIEKLFTFENFQIEKFDHDFNGFLSRVIFLNYELSKKFLEREREVCEDVQQELLTKDDEILSLKNKISSLEQRLIESRKMLKKSILETSSPKSKNAQSINDNMGLAPNRLTQVFKESPQKLLSPASQQDTTADSLIRTSANLTGNMNTYHRKNIPQRMGSPTQLEASMSDKLQNFDLERLTANLNNLEDNFFEDVDLNANRLLTGSSPVKSDKSRNQDFSTAKGYRNNQRDTKVVAKESFSKSNSLMPQTTKGSQTLMKQNSATSQPMGTPTSRGSGQVNKKEMVKSSSQKLLHQKLENKSEYKSGKGDTDHLTLSFFEDHNMSMDNIHFPTSVLSDTAAREMKNEFRKNGNLRETLISGNNSKADLSMTSQKKGNSMIAANKSQLDTSKSKPNIIINTSPILVKKKKVGDGK